jgi:hypothetical protein
VFTDLSGISGTGAVWADFGGTLGKVVDTAGTDINGAALKEAIRRGQIVTVHRGSDGTHPTLVVEKVENPADAGSSLTLDALRDVTAPANTPAGKFIGTTAVGEWGPVDAPNAVPMDPKGLASEWSSSRTYTYGNVVWTEDADGNRYYFSSDIQQSGGTAPSLTNLASWTYISGRGLLLEATLIPVSVSNVAGSSSVVIMWQAMAYPKGLIVRHRYQGFTRYWVSIRQTTASEQPDGSSGSPWQEASLLANTLALAERWKKWTGTQAQYNAIPVKDPDTLYAITG